MHQLPEIERTRFIHKLAQAVDQARADGSHLGLILVDLANLAGVNHNYGYETGDELLLTAYGQLLDLSKLPDSVFRMGGHSFFFYSLRSGQPRFYSPGHEQGISNSRFRVARGSGVHRVDIRIGIAVNRVGGQEFMTMLANAEASLLQSRLGGQLRIEDVLIDGDEVPAQQRLEQNLEEALLNNEFELHYQPKIEISSGKLHGAEALLRWQSPDGENISPEIIVEWAETTGRSYELTRWVVHRALRQMRQWQGRLDIGVAVNIPAGLAGDPDLPTLLHDALAIWGVAPEMVTAELTERALIEDKQAGYDNLLKLREMGVNVSIDDFGTGYSSLSYFKHIPARELKIDKSFIESMQSDIQNMELVKIIIHIARLFGLTVVAEGIEDSRSLSTLRELGCDYAQGYYFSRP